ncbi:histidinol-phosphatase [candidate division KSB1 bacterium]|nr:histidinol-phosphatase [candidate division KSB1 bacterium]
MKHTKRFIWAQILLYTFVFLFSTLIGISNAEDRNVRTEINIPDILEYQTLKCDFHMHTVFSDGLVWPTIRVEEAWREGLEVISITDHIEYLPFRNDVAPNHNRPYELAKSTADALGIVLIRGTEITRKMPPGHLNAIFLDDVEPLVVDDVMESIEAAYKQSAFIFWNHPGWKGQQPDGIAKWYEIHTKLYEKGWMHGIEVVNGIEYYPEVHQWCIDKKLTLMGNSDIHNPISFDYDIADGEHRPITLVFAKDKSLESIKDALVNRRTVVYWNNDLIGEQTYLAEIFYQSIDIENPVIDLTERSSAVVQIFNGSDVPFRLKSQTADADVSVSDEVTLQPGKFSVIAVRKKKSASPSPGMRTMDLSFTVQNLRIAADKGLPVVLKLQVNFD